MLRLSIEVHTQKLLGDSLLLGSPWLYSGFGGVVSPGKGGKCVERALSR